MVKCIWLHLMWASLSKVRGGAACAASHDELHLQQFRAGARIGKHLPLFC